MFQDAVLQRWLLDRWHIAQKVRGLVADNQDEQRRIMAPVWKADSEAVLEALRISPLRETRPLEFSILFGYILGNREGIDNWHVISAGLRRSLGRSIAPVRVGSGAIEKNIEVHINRRVKCQGRSWSRHGAEHLAQCSGSEAILTIGPTGGTRPLSAKPE
jgi:hypothetical protein